MVAMIAGCCSAISRPEAQTFIPGAAVKVSGADSVLADALASGRATTGWTPTSSLVLCGTSVGYTNQPPEQGQGAVRGLTGESSQAANPTSASASSGSTGIVRSRQKCFTEARLGVFRRSWSLQVRVDKRDLLCSSTPPCPASEARQKERGTSRARSNEPSKASASNRPTSKAPKAAATSVSTAQRRAGARNTRRKGSVARRLPGSVPACASGAPEKLL